MEVFEIFDGDKKKRLMKMISQQAYQKGSENQCNVFSDRRVKIILASY